MVTYSTAIVLVPPTQMDRIIIVTLSICVGITRTIAALCTYDCDPTKNLNCYHGNSLREHHCMQASDPADDTVRVSVASAQVDVRPGNWKLCGLLSCSIYSPHHVCANAGEPALLNVTISPAESTAVDMYLLMDLSLTMLPDLNNLRTTSGMLGMYKANC